MAELTAAEGEPPSRVLGVTCARDGREHLVADEAMTPANAGRYPALCGHAVWAAVLASPTGPPCAQCATVRATHHTSRRSTGAACSPKYSPGGPGPLAPPPRAQSPGPATSDPPE